MKSQVKNQPIYLFSKPFLHAALSITRFAMLGAFVLVCVYGLNHFHLSRFFPIKTVRVYGSRHIDRDQAKDLLLPLVNHGFFAANIDFIRERLLQMPWVANIFVRRNWPDQIEVTVVEKKAIALWNQAGLLSDMGEVFTPKEDTYPHHLPLLVGPEGKQITVLQSYKDINRILTPLHAKISYLELTPYFTWKLSLDNGIVLQMGHKDILTRLDQFVKVYPKIVGNRAADVDYVDLRYPNGIAVRWKQVIS